MVVALGHAQHAVVAVEGERWEALVLHRLLRVLGDLELRGKAEQVLTPLIGEGAGLVERHLGEAGVGHRVGEGELLLGGEADEAVEGDLVLGECVLGAQQGLLLGLELHAGAQHVEIDADTGVVGERGLAQHLFVRGDERLGVGDLRLVGQRGQILCADRLDHTSAHVERVHGDDIGGLLRGLV